MRRPAVLPHANRQKAADISTRVVITADDVAVGDPIRVCICTARKIDQNATSIPDQKTVLVSVRSVDPADHIAGRVEAAKKYISIARAADRIVNAAVAQEALTRTADKVSADDA